MELRDLAAIASKRRWVIIVAFLLTTALSVAFALAKEPRYEAVATLAVTPDSSRDQPLVSQDALSALLGTYAQTAESSSNLRDAAELLGRPLPGEVTATTEEGTGILRIAGNSASPEGARIAANAASSAFRESVETNELLRTQLVGPPSTPTTPLQPRPPLIIGVGAVLGLGLGLMLAVALEHFRRRIETSDDLADITNLPVIGQLPRERRLEREGAGIIWGSADTLSMQEGLRSLRTNLDFLGLGERPAILVTSPLSGEGKSTITANLGVAFSQIGIETTVVDCDLRRPSQDAVFGVENRRGVANLLAARNATVQVDETRYPALSLLTSGPLLPNSTEMLHIRFGGLMEKLRDTGSLLLIDSPPVLPVSDARLMAGQVDGVILVLTAGRVRPADLRTAIETLEAAGGRVLGIVLNRVGEERGGYGYHYHLGVTARPEPEELTAPASATR